MNKAGHKLNICCKHWKISYQNRLQRLHIAVKISKTVVEKFRCGFQAIKYKIRTLNTAVDYWLLEVFYSTRMYILSFEMK